MITKELIMNEWKKYHGKTNIELNTIFGRGFNWFDSEILYTLLRLIQPTNIIEMSPDKGYTTSIMLKACTDNDKACNILSFDLHGRSIKFDTKGKINRKLITGNVRSYLTNEQVKTCDFIFIDSNHSYDFGKWYATKVLPKLKKETFIWIHDWPTYKGNGWFGSYILDDTYEVDKKDQWAEPMAVKEFFINKEQGIPIMNTTDVLQAMDTDKPILNVISEGALSQILKRI